MVRNLYTTNDTGGQLYDLATRTWTEVAAPPPTQITSPHGTVPFPFTGSADQQVWTGTELLELTNPTSPGNPALLPGRAYNPETNTWRVLPPLPHQLALPQWAGTAVVGYSTDRGQSVVVYYLPT